MKKLLKKIYQMIAKKKSVKIFIRNVYCRTRIISDMLKKESSIPCVPIEHFYSPFPAMADIKNSIIPPFPHDIPGIDLNIKEQFDILDKFEPFYKELPFQDEKTDGLRYYYKNDFYSYSDAIFLYCMIRHLKPQRIIEIGSGFSSSVTLDTNEKFMQNSIRCTFIEPYPERLKSLLKNDDKAKVTIHEKKLQEIPLDVFSELTENDILFIDSTHVAKFNSDVNYIIHTILPALTDGVYIHFHDIFYPFEYPMEWLLNGHAWNEQYILRAFLQYNTKFKIVLFNTYLETMFREELEKRFPLIFKNTGGSIWIKKL
jgi:predicted O-methyltransferase YrrM